MSPTLGHLNRIVSRVAPPGRAESWDNVGLQIGDPEAPVSRVLVALEPSEQTLDEARELGAKAIVAHHPLIFRPVHHLREDSRIGRIAAKLARADVGFIAAHTNLDKSEAGPNFALAEALGIEFEDWLVPHRESDTLKFVIFTPAGHERAVIDAIHRGGGGVIGDYSHCTFRGPGTGTFFPHEGANPYIGKVGELEEAAELRLETWVPKRAMDAVLRETIAAHPYEEPAYDILPLEQPRPASGLGIVGNLKKPGLLGRVRAAALRQLRPLLPEAARDQWRGVQTVGPSEHPIRRAAICSGAGGSLIAAAGAAEVDCMITGEISYHDAIEAQSLGLTAICLGHFASEAAGIRRFAEALRAETIKLFEEDETEYNGSRTLDFHVAQSETDPILLASK